MTVRSGRMTEDDARHLLEAMSRWRAAVQSGRVRLLGVKPKLSDAEHYMARVPVVGAFSWPSAELDRPLPVPKRQGTAFATTDRLLLVGNFRAIVHEWAWSDLRAVEVLPRWTGVLLHPAADAGDVDVVAHAAMVVGQQGQLAVQKRGWLSVEGAYAAYRGELDTWFDHLPARLEALEAR